MKAWELLSKPGAWTQGALARDAQGDQVMPRDEDAICWCTMGAISKCYEDNVTEGASSRIRLLKEVGNIALWNDRGDRTQGEVISVLRSLDI